MNIQNKHRQYSTKSEHVSFVHSNLGGGQHGNLGLVISPEEVGGVAGKDASLKKKPSKGKAQKTQAQQPSILKKGSRAKRKHPSQDIVKRKRNVRVWTSKEK
eukprot:scaffold191_cov273-Chaetoceros_neogracile.AAC.27